MSKGDAYNKKDSSIGEELADVAIYLIGLAKMLNVDLETEITKKVERNKTLKEGGMKWTRKREKVKGIMPVAVASRTLPRILGKWLK